MPFNADKASQQKPLIKEGGAADFKSKKNSSFKIEDNRAVAAIQRKIQGLADNSGQVGQLMAMQQVADNSTQVMKHHEAQQMANNNNRKIVQAKVIEDGEIVQKKKNSTGLPDNLKSGIEHLSGTDISDVKVHYNSARPAQLNALAYAQGTDIHVAPGQEKHLPHEAWHIVQQKQGRVQPTVNVGGVAVNDSPSLEKEADKLGSQALQMKAVASDGLQIAASGNAPVAQLLGKGGHIAVGALIGTIVPLFGTIIGGYIGYRIWRSKQARGGQQAGAQPAPQIIEEEPQNEMPQLEGRSIGELEEIQVELARVAPGENEGKREEVVVAQGPGRVRKREDGKELNQTYENAMLEWLNTVRNHIQEGHYRQAYDMLMDVGHAARFAITLKVTEVSGGDPVALAKKNMSYAETRVATIFVPESTDWLDNRHIAGQVLPMHLEEFMHQYQARRNKFLSPNTGRFRQTGIVRDQAESMGFDDGDYDEIDVMAKLIDWGFDVEDIGYIERYEERERYWEWWQQQEH